MPELASFSATVYGRVQGVSFRAFVAAHARALGVTGWVQNLPDGTTVAVVAEGEKAALDKLFSKLRSGPPGARVDGVEVEWSQYTGDFTNFEVRH